VIVTPDELPDLHELRIGLTLNGVVMQQSDTSQLIFRINPLIAYLSRIFPLEPGDLIFTGTPPGVGFARKPPVFLKVGDVCEATIEGIGVLRNTCVATSEAET
jgi:2-keto-4-pentenoate hydratase/2-oxohepta-3-ene-1,7-dioic acid hydratase in catechol pathway